MRISQFNLIETRGHATSQEKAVTSGAVHVFYWHSVVSVTAQKPAGTSWVVNMFW